MAKTNAVPAPFAFESHAVRTTVENDEIWFTAKDVALALGYTESSIQSGALFNAIPDEWKGHKRIMTIKGEQKLTGEMKDLDAFIRGQLEDAYGKGTEYAIITHDGMEPEAGLMYGDDECIENFSGEHFGKLYTYFQPYGSWMVYKCYYTIPEGETDWSNIDYSSPEDIEISDFWGYPE